MTLQTFFAGLGIVGTVCLFGALFFIVTMPIHDDAKDEQDAD